MPESTNAFTCGSSLADKSSFLVEPKLTSFAFFSFNSLFAVSKNSSSFGEAPGQPPSIKLTPKLSISFAIAILSFTDGEIPSCWKPSLKVVSNISIFIIPKKNPCNARVTTLNTLLLNNNYNFFHCDNITLFFLIV